ncbi:hypothetical protein D3C71_1158650 [compost metagenome]
MELVGQRAQALGEQAQAGHLDRQLARLGLHQRAFGAHDIAQVPVLEGGIQVFAHGVTGHIELNAAAHVAQRSILHGCKTGLAHHALEHHAASHGDVHWRGFEGLVRGSAVFLVQLGSLVAGLEVIGEGNPTASGLDFAQSAELFAALCDELVFVLGSGGVVLV